MSIYKYVAKDITSKKIRGKAEVNSRSELVAFLRTQDLYLLSCDEVNEEEKRKRLKLNELSSFSHEIGTMMESGISLIRAMLIMTQSQEVKVSTRDIYKDIYVKLQQGLTLSAAMQAQGQAFPDLMVHMYQAGETSGQLGKTALLMAKQYEKNFKLQNTVRTAATYPTILVSVSILVIIIIFTFVLPEFFDTFTSMDIDLPFITMIMLELSQSMRTYWYVYILSVLIIFVILRKLSQIDKIRYQLDRAKLKVNKKVANMLCIIYTARFARTLCSLYASGMTMINALTIMRKTVNNTYIEAQFDRLIRDIRNGTTLSQAIAKVDGLSPKLSNSIYIGEESGKLEEMLESLADDYDYQAEQATQKLVALMEPALIIILGVLIGAVLISVMLPIYTMYQSTGAM